MPGDAATGPIKLIAGKSKGSSYLLTPVFSVTYILAALINTPRHYSAILLYILVMKVSPDKSNEDCRVAGRLVSRSGLENRTRFEAIAKLSVRYAMFFPLPYFHSWCMFCVNMTVYTNK